MAKGTGHLPKPWDSPEAIELWKSDPLECLLHASASDPALQDYFRKEYAGMDPQAIRESWGCWLCHKTVEGTLELILTASLVAIVGAIVGSDGADVPAVPAEVEAAVELSAVTIAEETGVEVTVVEEVSTTVIKDGFKWIVANKAKAAALFLADELIGDLIFTPIAERVCSLGNKC